MEGELKPWPGDEQFAQFLVDRAQAYSRLSFTCCER